MKTVITNGIITINFDKNASILANFKNAKEQGYPGGKTGFFHLVKGDQPEAVGFKMVEVKTEAKKTLEVARKNLNIATFAEAEAAIHALSTSFTVRQGTKYVYGKARGTEGRVQITPKVDGVYRVEYHGTVDKATMEKFNMVSKQQYVYAFLNMDEAKQLIKQLGI
ncbi:hypothetical protein Kuja_0640 [Vibrio phage vB_VchM_Kuja]|uniref:Uncharacterized protein n=1 Tax=Vibrio phage vB_VchM_Kuja TaxID=2686437 RepID=A0A6B9J5F7_9CAUD|nr:hypothetical protein HWC83_gp172 [Vibrio phage vB_VchM_Kuja]QGZ16055.1 hypothetical protein Kuja_0640 [Vibrio phage vB_VchM_Kuja]